MQGMSFGPADLAASRRMKTTRVGGGHPGYRVIEDPDPDNPDAPRATAQQDPWHYSIARMVDACTGAGILPFYGPYGDIKDVEGCETQFRAAFLLGCVGAWSLHPAQIDIAKKVFSPDPDEVRFAKKVIEAIPDGRGVHMIDGKMQDDATWKQCKVMVDLAEMLARKDPELAEAYELEPASALADLSARRSDVLTARHRTFGGQARRSRAGEPVVQHGAGANRVEARRRDRSARRASCASPSADPAGRRRGRRGPQLRTDGVSRQCSPCSPPPARRARRLRTFAPESVADDRPGARSAPALRAARARTLADLGGPLVALAARTTTPSLSSVQASSRLRTARARVVDRTAGGRLPDRGRDASTGGTPARPPARGASPVSDHALAARASPARSLARAPTDVRLHRGPDSPSAGATAADIGRQPGSPDPVPGELGCSRGTTCDAEPPRAPVDRVPRRHALLRVRGPRDRQAGRDPGHRLTASPPPTRRRARSRTGSAARP